MPDLYNKFSVADVTLFNVKWSEYTQTLTYVGNSVELLIVAAIGGKVGYEAQFLVRDTKNKYFIQILGGSWGNYHLRPAAEIKWYHQYKLWKYG